MKVLYSDLGIKIEITENEVYSIVLENPDDMKKFVEELWNQSNGDDGKIIVSDNEKIVRFDKVCDVVLDPFSINLNSRKIINKLYADMEIMGNERPEEMGDINSRVVNLIDIFTTSLGYCNVEYNLDFKWTDIFKIYNLRFADNYENLVEKISYYIKIISEMTESKVLFLVNMKSFFSKDELENIYRTAMYNKIGLVMVDSQRNVDIESEKVYIVDKDHCLILI